MGSADKPELKWPQFSLRSFFFALTALGLLVGSLVSSFQYAPGLFQVIVGITCYVFPACAALGTIMAIGAKQRDLRLIFWGILIAVLPAIGLITLGVASPYLNRSGPQGLTVLSTQQILQQRLPGEIDQPWIWIELESRLAAGKMNGEEANEALLILTKYMRTTRPTGWKKPLSWQNAFLKSVLGDRVITEETMLDFCDAYYGSGISCEGPTHLTENEERFKIRVKQDYSPWADNDGVPLRRVFWPKQASINGEPVKIIQDANQARQLSKSQNYGYEPWKGEVVAQLKPGESELSIEVECAYFTPDQLVGLSAGLLDKDRWPAKSAKKWTQSAKVKLRVVDSDQPVIEVVTDPQLNPLKTGAFAVPTLVLQREGDNKSRLILVHNEMNPDDVAYSFNIFATIDGKEHMLGYQARSKSMQIGSNRMFVVVDRPPSDTLTADLRYEPTLEGGKFENLKERRGFNRIWGKPIVFYDLLLERHDLEDREDNSPNGDKTR